MCKDGCINLAGRRLCDESQGYAGSLDYGSLEKEEQSNPCLGVLVSKKACKMFGQSPVRWDDLKSSAEDDGMV